MRACAKSVRKAGRAQKVRSARINAAKWEGKWPLAAPQNILQRPRRSTNVPLQRRSIQSGIWLVGKAMPPNCMSGRMKPLYLHKDDLFLYENAVSTGTMFGLSVEEPPPVDHFYEGEGPIAFGDYQVRVVHTPGHCPGGVCLAITKTGDTSAPHLFVGDTLFAGSIGRTDLPGGDYETLLRSITGTLLAFPDAAIVYSGHGPETTIGRERATNPFVLDYLATRTK